MEGKRMSRISRETKEFKCDLCDKWHDLPYQYFHKQRVCKECKDYLEDEYDMQVDQALHEGIDFDENI